METPRLKQIKTGWAAVGNGWAVHGATKEEAERLFTEAEHKHKLILERRDETVVGNYE